MESADAIRILVVDDISLIRDSLRTLLASYPRLEVVGEACDGEEAVRKAALLKPSVVVMDINMPRLNGVSATARIKRTSPQVQVVGLSFYATEDIRQLMKEAGATAVIPKEAAVTQLGDEILASVNSRSSALH